MNANEIVNSKLLEYNFNNYPKEYKKELVKVLNVATNVFGNNLLSITIGGSGGKDNIIDGWSDLDIYFILKDYIVFQVTSFEKQFVDDSIHVGTTYYTLDEVETNNIDNKTKVMIYEKNNYYVNPTLYGDDYYNDVSYEEILCNDKNAFPVVLQALRRMYIEVLNGSRKIDKTYMKKMLVLLKCILSSYEIFSYGYDNVFNEYLKLSEIDVCHVKLSEVLKNLDEYSDFIISFTRQIFSFIDKNIHKNMYSSLNDRSLVRCKLFS